MEVVTQKEIEVKRNVLKVLRTIVVNGEICAPGTFIEVSRSDAKDMVGREVAEEAVEAEVGEGNIVVCEMTREEIRSFLDEAL